MSPRRITIRRRSNTSSLPSSTDSEPAPQHYSADPAPRYSPEYPTHNGWPGLPPAPQYSASDPFVPPSQQYAPAAPAPHHDDQGYAQPNYGGQPYADPRGRPGMENHFPDRAAFSAADFPAPPERPGYAPPLYPQEPEAGPAECRRRMTMGSMTIGRAAAGAKVS